MRSLLANLHHFQFSRDENDKIDARSARNKFFFFSSSFGIHFITEAHNGFTIRMFRKIRVVEMRVHCAVCTSILVEEQFRKKSSYTMNILYQGPFGRIAMMMTTVHDRMAKYVLHS